MTVRGVKKKKIGTRVVFRSKKKKTASEAETLPVASVGDGVHGEVIGRDK